MSSPIPKTLISNGGVIVHYNRPYSRPGKYRPWCQPYGWQKTEWQLDDGVGAKECRRCSHFYEIYLEKRREKAAADERARYNANLSGRKERHKIRRQDPMYLKARRIKVRVHPRANYVGRRRVTPYIVYKFRQKAS